MAAAPVQDVYAEQVLTQQRQHLNAGPVEETGHGVVVGQHHTDGANLQPKPVRREAGRLTGVNILDVDIGQIHSPRARAISGSD